MYYSLTMQQVVRQNGPALRAARGDRSLRHVAAAVGYHYSLIGKVEQEATALSWRLLIALAGFYGEDPQAFIREDTQDTASQGAGQEVRETVSVAAL